MVDILLTVKPSSLVKWFPFDLCLLVYREKRYDSVSGSKLHSGIWCYELPSNLQRTTFQIVLGLVRKKIRSFKCVGLW